ncbi:glutamine-hydrolyzing carbamoyl-phosphate synthase small subunit [Entomobacter blattae]|uniref:Carbamoyl phosphate synthase small chain n=1 Tax=Entomobacter blattae TaxID=2762277 RepID=A0A7H1NNB1_9PROT|nr:glutamine-hydrolyzing carbamoyl-phosphate synthase small subunit [Entomobacter blattae]QNT77271.1 Carbamoyl-phosphate synthase small chain [Entomobacter blattae]
MANVEQIITLLGGAEKAAQLTGVSTEAIRKWRQGQAIPAKHWSIIIQATGLDLNDLQAPSSPDPTEPSSAHLPPHGATAALILADGSLFWGKGFGAHTLSKNQALGEICFSTGMTGYQETLTDPSFASQIITFTFPHIGNVGTNHEDDEALSCAAKALVVKEDITHPSSWRSFKPLEQWLLQHAIPGICGIDTRTLTLLIRDKGPQTGLLYYPPDGHFDTNALLVIAKAWPGLEGMDLAKEVTCRQTYHWKEGVWVWPHGTQPSETPTPKKVVAVDYGAKRNILRCLVSAGCDVTVVPATASVEDILRHSPDGIFLSNGPGDPAATAEYAAPVIKALLEKDIPLFGICLGHQLLAHALGGKTYKLDQGHRGANQPVKNLKTGKVEITSQNHGFAVDENSLPPDIEVTHTSLFDGSNEGIESKRFRAFSVQYHPEASPGPTDSHYLFNRFMDMMNCPPKTAKR